MADEYLIVLGASVHQAPIYRTAARLGLKTVALDYNKDAEAIKYADAFILASVRNSNKKECIEKLRASGLKYSGVVASGIEASPLASAIAKEFNLIWVSEETAHKTTNKGARAVALENAGIPVPKFKICRDALVPMGMDFPFVVKPSDNSGSRGVRTVTSEKEWGEAYEEAKSLSSDGQVIVEELLHGSEVSIEGFVIDGEMFIHGFSDRNFIPGYEPYFMEDGSTSPTSLSVETVAEVKRIFSEAAKVVGVHVGPCKGDLIVTEEGVKVLEITSRFSPLFPMVTPHMTGMDPLEVLILWATGKDVPKSMLQSKFSKAMAHRYFFHKPGRITKVTGFEDLGKQPGVKEVITLHEFSVGDIIAPPSYINRLFYIATIADTREQAVAEAERALKTVRIEVEAVLQ